MAFYPFKYSYKFVFNSVSGALLDSLISVLTEKVIGFTDVVLSIHYYHCHPLVCCQYYVVPIPFKVPYSCVLSFGLVGFGG